MYSALKVDGKKLLDLARAGQTVERKARKVSVDRIELYPTESQNEYILNLRVSKGTYVRTLCADIGKKLGTGAVMSSLIRTSCGPMGIEDAFTEEELSDMSIEERYAILKPVEELFADLDGVVLGDFFARLASHGCELYQKKLGLKYPIDTLVRLIDSEGFFAIGRVTEFPDGLAIKPIKQFRI
jgi:tRNA pseudouridine55 synthase